MYFSNQKILLISLLSLNLMACSPQSFEAFKNMRAVSSGNTLNVDKLQCEKDPADYHIQTNVLAYELVDKANLTFGFNLLSGFFKALGLSLQTSKGTMTLTMELYDPLKPHQSVAHVLSTADSRGINFNANVDLVKAGIDIGYYYQTPLSKLTEKGLRNSLKEVMDQLSQVEIPWKTRIYMKSSDNYYIIPTGTVAGLKLGDELKIYNVQNMWKGEPCQSELMISQKIPSHPVATAVVDQIDTHAAVIKLLTQDNDYQILSNAVVEIQKLAKSNDSRKLYRAVDIGNINSLKLKVGDKNDIDVVAFMREQIKPVLREFGYYAK